mmetsp:Transcript_107065/g.207492  ORF Transcript_107065/g.207492 Transcript_107065/m.207492 type:complete len:276 (-) Transcript_107065:81-908(-)
MASSELEEENLIWEKYDHPGVGTWNDSDDSSGLQLEQQHGTLSTSAQGAGQHVFDTPSTTGSKSSHSSASFAAEHLQTDDGLQIKRLQYQQHQRMLRERFQGMSVTELASVLPVMPSGEPSSMGSVLHQTDQCRPCLAIAASTTCKAGIQCMFCHLPHEVPPQVLEAMRHGGDREKGRKNRRPSKAQRAEYRGLVALHEATIRRDPFNWKVESVIVPPYLSNPTRTQKFLRRLENIAADARSRSTGVADVPRAASASSTSNCTQNGDRARRLVSL